MRLLPAWYPLDTLVAEVLPALAPSLRRQLSLWVAGTLLAGSGCEDQVVGTLVEATVAAGEPVAANTVRQDLRELLRDAAEKRTPGGQELPVAACFAPLLHYLVTKLGGTQLALAVDATNYQDRFTALVISVLYRGHAIPVAWDLRACTTKGEWMPVILDLLDTLAPAVPATHRVLVLADEGLWSPRLFRRVRDHGWSPLLRGHLGMTVTLASSGRQCVAGTLVEGTARAWVGRVVLFKTRRLQLCASVLVVWGTGHAAAWMLITALAPRAVGVYWYGLRAWIECGFRDLKALGWQWERTQRQDERRVARHWLVLALATLAALAAGTLPDEAERQGVPRDQAQRPLTPPPPRTGQRSASVFSVGSRCLRAHLPLGRLPPLWFVLEAWPTAPPDVRIQYDDDPDPTYASLPP